MAILKVGDRISKYLITEKLGEGGMGVVFAAKHEALGRDVAVKILHGHFAQRSDLMERFFREAEAVSQIGHPNIVAVYDFGKLDDGSLYYVMERVAGETFKQRLRREPSLERDEIAAIFTQIARALGVTHERGITHRDLKPDNVLLQTQLGGPPHVKLLDYGIAKVRETAANPALTEAGDVLGTPAYMAPEQVEAAQLVDGRADLYSLATMLYEVYAGAPPFVGEPMKVMIAHMDAPVPPIGDRAVRPLSTELEAFLMRALSKRPDDRLPTAAAFARGMQRAMGIVVAAPTPLIALMPSAVEPAPAPTVTAPVVPIEREAPTSVVVAPSAPRKPAPVLLVVAVAVVVGLIVGVGYWALGKSNEHARIEAERALLDHAAASTTSTTRRSLAELIGDHPAPAALPALITLVKDDDPEVRRAAALASIDMPDPTGALDAALLAAEEQSGAQIAIDIALTRALRDPKVSFGLLEAIATQLDSVSFLRFVEARVRRQQLPLDAIGRALLQAPTASPRDRRRAMRALAREPAGQSVLTALVADTTRPLDWRNDATLALGDKTNLKALVRSLHGATLIEALVTVGDADAIDKLLDDPDGDTRAAAIASMAWRPSQIAAVRKHANDSEARVRLAVALALRVFSDAEMAR